jgi:hypothetical protein
MNKKFKILFFVLILALILIPILSFADGSLVSDSCGGIGADGKLVECGFNDLMDLVNRVINFILTGLVIPIAAIMFFYAGFLMITAGGESASSRTKAKHIFTNAVWGLVLAAAAWIIIHTLLSILGYEGSWIGF